MEARAEPLRWPCPTEDHSGVSTLYMEGASWDAADSPADGDDFDLPRYGSANHLTDDRYFDTLSGRQAYKCFACRLRKG